MAKLRIITDNENKEIILSEIDSKLDSYVETENVAFRSPYNIPVVERLSDISTQHIAAGSIAIRPPLASDAQNAFTSYTIKIKIGYDEKQKNHINVRIYKEIYVNGKILRREEVGNNIAIDINHFKGADTIKFQLLKNEGELVTEEIFYTQNV